MKKVFLVSSLVFGILLLFLGIYNLVFRNNPYNPKTAQEKVIEANEEVDESFLAQSNKTDGVIQKITQEKVLTPVFRGKTDSVLYLSAQNQAIKEISLLDGSVRTLLALSGIPSQAVWSPDVTRALVELEAGGEKRWHLIDLGSGGDAVLKAGMENPDWDNLGEKIIYKYYDATTKERSLNVANPDGSEWRVIVPEVTFPKARVAMIPQSAAVSFWNEGNAFEETALRSVALAGGEASAVFSGRFGGDYRFSPDGKRIAASFSDQKGGSGLLLALMNNKGGEFRNLSIPTLVSKVAWSKDSRTLYYALPGALVNGAVLPNDYYAKPLFTQDTFWKIDTQTGQKERVVDLKHLEIGYDASHLFLDENEEFLFFINRTDGMLYRIALER
jgi:hypothetical protein